jgi:translin
LSELETIAEKILGGLEEKNRAREAALSVSRRVIQRAANSIRATHREERDKALNLLDEASQDVASLRQALAEHQDLYFAGYVQDALKEYAEASITYALTEGGALPDPDELGVEYAAYLNGLGEAVGELRRYVLDLIRRDDTERCEELLAAMDEIYGFLVTVDFPKAITGGLRRTTDMVRGVLERTRGDLTLVLQQRRLERALKSFEPKGGGGGGLTRH